MRGQVEDGFAALQRGRALARAARAGPSLVWLAVIESDVLLKLGRFQHAAEVASHGLEDARQGGLLSWYAATMLAANAAEALLALGRITEAAALIDPLTTTPPDRYHPLVHVARAEIDLLRGGTDAAAGRWRQIYAFPANLGRVDFGYEAAPRAAEAALWAARSGDALQETKRALALFQAPDLTILCGRLLVAGMRACADLGCRTGPDMHGGGRPRHCLTPGSQPRRLPPHCVPLRLRPTGMHRYWRRSASWPSGRGSGFSPWQTPPPSHPRGPSPRTG